MCGLAGFMTSPGHSLPDAEKARRARDMIAILNHRGPDGSAVWCENEIGLAHARLAIIDTSTSANQPMHEADGLFHIVFNGEIYNFQDVRRDLEAAGHKFRTQGDTEAILLGYKQWGLSVFERLAGMFAIAIWESKTRRLILARDRMGEKPLAYAVRPEGFVFGSEIKALLTWPGFERAPDKDRIHDYLTFGFVTGPGSAFKGVERLPPAHVMIVEAGRPVMTRPYWTLPHPSEQRERTPRVLEVETIDRLAEAVEGCLVADVPLGAFLSGGVDSSAVVAMISARCGRRNIETFSSGFGFGEYDETRYAKEVAARYQTSHNSFRFGTELLGNVGKLAWHYDEPFSDSSALVAHALARETRKKVTVAVTGDGADETFMGYARYFNFGDIMRDTPERRTRRMGPLYRHSTAAADGKRAATDSYGFLMERFREAQKLKLYNIGMLPMLQNCSYERLLPFYMDCEMPEELAARLDCGLYLPDDLLVKIDIAAMANSLETRAPFLNHNVVEFAARIKPSQRVWGREGKALLKKALEPYLPHDTLYRTKMGFRVPVAHFMRNEAREETEALLLSERFLDRGIVRADAVRQMLADHVSQKEEHGTRLWSLVMLELWFRTWIDSDSNRRLSENEDPFLRFSQQAMPVQAAREFALA